MIKFEIVVQIRRFIYAAKEVYRELATFRNNNEIGLIELLQMNVASKCKEIPWILVKRWHIEIQVEVV